MAQSVDELFTEQNQRLFDMLFRHQVYLEGWKTGLAAGYVAYLNKLYVEFAGFLHQNRYARVDYFTKVQLADFVRRFTLAQTKFYAHYTEDLINVLKQFMADEVDTHKAILLAVTAKNVTEANTHQPAEISDSAYEALSLAMQADYTGPIQDAQTPGDDAGPTYHYELADHYDANKQASGIYGLAAVNDSDRANTQLWGNITNSPIPATGALMLAMIADFGTQTNLRLSQLVNQGYAQSWQIAQLETAMLGTDSNFAGGLFETLVNQHRAMLVTVVQHVSNEAQAAVSSLYFERYQYVAIMDSHTTLICQDLNGNVYIYGDGPLPPMHYGCRSKDVPVASEQHLHDASMTYSTWIESQAVAFLTDAFADYTTSTNVSTTKPLTLTQFQSKLKYILGDSTDAL